MKVPTAYQSAHEHSAVNKHGLPKPETIKAIESHTAAHTAALREEIVLYKKAILSEQEIQRSLKEKNSALRERVKELEDQNTRYRQALESIATRCNKVAEHNEMRTALHLIQQDVFEALKQEEQS